MTNTKGIWIFVEQENGIIAPPVFEILAKAQELKEHNGEEIVAILPGFNVAGLAPVLIACGADEVIVAENENLASYSARPYQQVLTELAKKYSPSIILYPATSLGRDLAPRIMVSLKTGLTADAVDLGYDEDGTFVQTTPAYGGVIMAHIAIPEKRPQMATVRPGIFTPLEPDEKRVGKIIIEEVSVEADHCIETISSEPKKIAGIPISEAKIIVSGGRGIKSADDLALLEELASLLHGELASSRPPVDEGLLSHDRQIGQSGTTVKPELIINTAISGSTQYKIGMSQAKLIVSVNKLASAPIFNISNYGAVTDYHKFIPALISEIKKRS